MVAPASELEAEKLEVLRGPNIKPFPSTEPLKDKIDVTVGLKVADNITTDHIMPAGAKILPYRSNIPYLSKFCFSVVDETFSERAIQLKSSVIIGGDNYGQGSSREHAALVPLYLGIKAVVAKSFARIHVANLINAGIIPLTFKNASDYDEINQGDKLSLENLFIGFEKGEVILKNATTGKEYALICSFTERQIKILKAGGLLAYTKQDA